MVLFVSNSRILRYLSMLYIGPGQLKSKPNDTNILLSKSINDCLETFFYSSSVRSEIIRLKLGDIGCSIFAAISIAIVARQQTLFLGKFQCPTSIKYRSIILTAINSVSSLYSFFACKSKTFCTA